MPIVDGTLVPTRDHRLAAPSKNYRYSTNVQIAIDARLVIARPPAPKISETTSSAGSPSMSFTTTAAPHVAACSANALPNPRPAPVMTTALPSR